ncbi:MAG: hypothetical protein J2P41_03815, partial [Blastocatellia bacterium]|nr:hypothetical protein [Blastocatellia bacterium]
MKPVVSLTIRISMSACAAVMLLVFFTLIKQHGPALAQGNGALNQAIFKSLQFRSIGPTIMGGRIDDFAVVENNTSIIYAASASGGI